MPNRTDAQDRLQQIGQQHLLNFFDELDEQAQQALLAQVAALDIDQIPSLIDEYVTSAPTYELPPAIEPAPYYPADATGSSRTWDINSARERGETLLREGKVACFTVAGGQGSRLGYDGPKGCYPASPIKAKPLFQLFAEGIRATAKRFGSDLPWYVMTSPLNHEQTVAFFEQNDHFGLKPDSVRFFPQGVMPSFDKESGKILLASRDRIATNPDGHGGSLTALFKSGAIDDMAGRGVEHISYFQVDNPLVFVADPVFLGLHAGAEDSSGEMSSKMLPKAYAEEKLGMFIRSGGRTHVVEYSDLPMDRQRETLDDGTLRFIAGSPAIHAISVEFVRRLNTDAAFSMPWHRAVKKVAHVDATTGEDVTPAEPNAVKLERFVFDALPMCGSSIVLETSRAEEFGPIKNAEGTDSPESSKQLQVERAAGWLENIGFQIPRKGDGTPDCTIELSPLTAAHPDQLVGQTVVPISAGAQIVL